MAPWNRFAFCLPSWKNSKTDPQSHLSETDDLPIPEDQQLPDVSDDGSTDSNDTNAENATVGAASAPDEKDAPETSERKPAPLKTTYYIIRRDDCPLLRYSWQRLWRQVVMRSHTHRKENNALTQFSQRTALHLCTCAKSCPVDVARELILYNRHALLLCDRQGYTPLHNVCALNAPKELVELLCDRAMEVERDMLVAEFEEPSKSCKATRWDKPNRFFASVDTLPKRRTFQTPLMLASKSGASPEIFRLLLDTRRSDEKELINGRQVGEWIAPWTGAEPYWDASIATITMPPQYASPLEVLIQDRSHLLSLKYLQMDEDKRRCLRGIFLKRFNRPESDGYVPVVRRNSISTLRNSPHKCTSAIKEDELLVDDENSDFGTAAKFDCSEPVKFEETLQLWTLIMEFFAEYLSPPVGKRNGQPDPPTQTGLLHAVASLTTPNPTLFELILDVFGAEDATRRDERQMLPLHHALMALQLYNNSVSESSLADRFVVYRQKQYQLIVSLLIQAPQPKVIQDRHFPNGQTSLIRALEANAPMALLDELTAATNELEIVDTRSRLYPFAVAATLDYALSDVYCLLSQCPQVLQHAI